MIERRPMFTYLVLSFMAGHTYSAIYITIHAVLIIVD